MLYTMYLHCTVSDSAGPRHKWTKWLLLAPWPPVCLFFHIFDKLNKWHKWIYELMNNSRQDDSDFVINIPGYSCSVCQCLSQRLWHVSKGGLLNEPTGPKRSRGPEAQVIALSHYLNKSKSKRLWIWTNLAVDLFQLAIPKMHKNTNPPFPHLHLLSNKYFYIILVHQIVIFWLGKVSQPRQQSEKMSCYVRHRYFPSSAFKLN